jgi:hypothetical protein
MNEKINEKEMGERPLLFIIVIPHVCFSFSIVFQFGMFLFFYLSFVSHCLALLVSAYGLPFSHQAQTENQVRSWKAT